MDKYIFCGLNQRDRFEISSMILFNNFEITRIKI